VACFVVTLFINEEEMKRWNGNGISQSQAQNLSAAEF